MPSTSILYLPEHPSEDPRNLHKTPVYWDRGGGGSNDAADTPQTLLVSSLPE